MPQVVLTRLALLDLERLRLFLRERNPEAADRAALAIQATIEKIRLQPEMYKPVPNQPFHREAIINFGAKGYITRFFYQPGGHILILRIRHQLENDYPEL